MDIYTVYFNPSDYPGKYVVRVTTIVGARGIVGDPGVFDSLENARECIPQSLMRMDRLPEDDPVIVEVWI